MKFRQTYKGIFQFKDQETLNRAMAETQAEALGADAMGLQDCYHGSGVMLLNIDTHADDNEWEEMAVAMATLAMHASRGFLYAVSKDGNGIVEYYEADSAFGMPPLKNSDSKPGKSEDYFIMKPGDRYVYATENGDVEWTVRKAGDSCISMVPNGHEASENKYWNGSFFYKVNSLVFAVPAQEESELADLTAKDCQAIYSNEAKPGDSFYAIWTEDDTFVEYKIEGFENLSLPAGSFDRCLKIRVDVYRLNEEEMTAETMHQYFAKGKGLVKWEKNGSFLELKEYHEG